MKRPLLKSKRGCIKCKARRVKCDEQKPVCGHCARLQLPCQWARPEQRSSTQKLVERTRSQAVPAPPTKEPAPKLPEVQVSDRRDSISTSSDIESPSFDSPAVLRTHAAPYGGDKDCKLILRYVADQGTAILRFPTTAFATRQYVNLFREGFKLAVFNPTYMHALVCIGAGHLTKTCSSWEEFALRSYARVMPKLRVALTQIQKEPPAEWVCAVVSILAFYELIAFHSAQSRLAHLVAFHRLVEARLSQNQPWLPLKILVEQYIHSLANGCLFHHDLLVGDKPISWMDSVVALVNKEPRPLGREIVGVPEQLTVAAYRLAVLNTKDITRSPWDIELLATAATLSSWKPPLHALEASGAPLLLIGKLYHLACTCLLQSITDREANATNSTIISTSVLEASCLLQQSELQFEPFNSMVWPLTVLAIFVTDKLQRLIIRQPILRLIECSKVEGYRSILLFLSIVEEQGLGPKVLSRPDLLKMIHM